MRDKICSFCGEYYDFDKGHDYDKCVEECDKILREHTILLADLVWKLRKAKEVQAQDWWRAKACPGR